MSSLEEHVGPLPSWRIVSVVALIGWIVDNILLKCYGLHAPIWAEGLLAAMGLFAFWQYRRSPVVSEGQVLSKHRISRPAASDATVRPSSGAEAGTIEAWQASELETGTIEWFSAKHGWGIIKCLPADCDRPKRVRLSQADAHGLKIGDRLRFRTAPDPLQRDRLIAADVALVSGPGATSTFADSTEAEAPLPTDSTEADEQAAAAAGFFAEESDEPEKIDSATQVACLAEVAPSPSIAQQATGGVPRDPSALGIDSMWASTHTEDQPPDSDSWAWEHGLVPPEAQDNRPDSDQWAREHGLVPPEDGGLDLPLQPPAVEDAGNAGLSWLDELASAVGQRRDSDHSQEPPPPLGQPDEAPPPPLWQRPPMLCVMPNLTWNLSCDAQAAQQSLWAAGLQGWGASQGAASEARWTHAAEIANGVRVVVPEDEVDPWEMEDPMWQGKGMSSGKGRYRSDGKGKGQLFLPDWSLQEDGSWPSSGSRTDMIDDSWRSWSSKDDHLGVRDKRDYGRRKQRDTRQGDRWLPAASEGDWPPEAWAAWDVEGKGRGKGNGMWDEEEWQDECWEQGADLGPRETDAGNRVPDKRGKVQPPKLQRSAKVEGNRNSRTWVPKPPPAKEEEVDEVAMINAKIAKVLKAEPQAIHASRVHADRRDTKIMGYLFNDPSSATCRLRR